MGSHAGMSLIILAVAVAVGIDFQNPVRAAPSRSNHTVSVVTLAEHSLGPLQRDLNATVQHLDRVESTIDTVKEKIPSTVSRGRDFLDEKGSVISSAVEAGKEAYARRKAQVPVATGSLSEHVRGATP